MNRAQNSNYLIVQVWKANEKFNCGILENTLRNFSYKIFEYNNPVKFEIWHPVSNKTTNKMSKDSSFLYLFVYKFIPILRNRRCSNWSLLVLKLKQWLLCTETLYFHFKHYTSSKCLSSLSHLYKSVVSRRCNTSAFTWGWSLFSSFTANLFFPSISIILGSWLGLFWLYHGETWIL